MKFSLDHSLFDAEKDCYCDQVQGNAKQVDNRRPRMMKVESEVGIYVHYCDLWELGRMTLRRVARAGK